jgi:AraC-like DNA-binding protein
MRIKRLDDIAELVEFLKSHPIDPARAWLWQQLKNKPMSYTKIFAVPDPLGVHHFDDFDDALEFAQAQGLSPGRILTEYLDENGNPINAPQGEVDENEIARQEALRIAQETIAQAQRIAQASRPSEFTQAPQVTPQDLGAPSPVPYSLFYRRPSADIDPTGQETRQSTISSKTLQGVINEVMGINPINGLDEFIEGAFEAGAYRLEIIVGDVSIKVYKHPNN